VAVSQPAESTANGTVRDGIKAQTEQALRNLSGILQAAGASTADLIKTTIFYTNIDDFPKINRVYAQHMPDPPPARSAPANVGLAPRAAHLDRRHRRNPGRG
jgi:2-iminobutanoate/2-iminopropanoate deaminase